MKSEHIDLLQDELDYFKKAGYELNWDALWKWAWFLKVAKQLNLFAKPFKCIDMGGGMGPTHFILSNYGEVINVDTGGFEKTWFPINDQGFYTKSNGLPTIRENIQYIQDDFLKFVRNIPNNSIDFYVDGCSMIHFDTQTRYSQNDGVLDAVREITRTLKPGGYLISTSHVAHPSAPEFHDMLHPQRLGSYLASSGLKYVTKVDWEADEFFQDLGNAHYCDTEIRKNRGFIRNTTAGCDGCENLPEYHCLLLADVRNTFVANCLYTLVKPKRGRLEWLLRIFYSKAARFWKIGTRGGLIETIRRSIRVSKKTLFRI